MQTVIRINNLDETIELGKQLGELLKPNMLITLSGDLGAGKTTFTKGIGLGLEIKKIINLFKINFLIINSWDIINQIFFNFFSNKKKNMIIHNINIAKSITLNS